MMDDSSANNNVLELIKSSMVDPSSSGAYPRQDAKQPADAAPAAAGAYPKQEAKQPTSPSPDKRPKSPPPSGGRPEPKTSYPVQEAKQDDRTSSSTSGAPAVDPRKARRRRRNRNSINDANNKSTATTISSTTATTHNNNKLKTKNSVDCDTGMSDSSNFNLMDLVATRSHSPQPPQQQHHQQQAKPSSPSVVISAACSSRAVAYEASNNNQMTDKSGRNLMMDKSGASLKTIDMSGASWRENKSGVTLHSRRRLSDNTRLATVEEPILSAVRVDEDELELHIRQQITDSAAQAEVIDLSQETNDQMQTELQKVRHKYMCWGLSALLLVVVIAAVIVGTTMSGSQQHTTTILVNGTAVPIPPPPTLKSVRERGHLRCGISKRDEYTQLPASYTAMWKGFNEDFCKAIAAATLDGDVNVTVYDIAEAERWQALKNGTIDVLTVGTPSTIESSYFDVDPSVPVTFSTPFLFDGVGVAGRPDWVDRCASAKGFRNFLECKDVSVCIVGGSVAWEVFEQILHPSQMVEVASFKDAYVHFCEDCCNMIATDWSYERIKIKVTKATNYSGPYSLGKALYTKQPYALATLKAKKDHSFDEEDVEKVEDDPQVWSEWVDWVLQSLIAAEKHNITQATADVINPTEIFGEKYQHGFQNAVSAVGNYGEIYLRNFQYVPRVGMNFLANGSTGLQFHRSIGYVNDFGTLDKDGTLAAIRQRGKLVCGIPASQNRNYTLQVGEKVNQPTSSFLVDSNPVSDIGDSSIDMELCRALAAGLFQGLSITDADTDACLASPEDSDSATTSKERIEFVLLSDEAEGYTKLNDGEVDVIAGYRFSMESDVKEPTTGEGYAYSQSYLYAPVLKGEDIAANNRCMVTRQNDHQWSDFVQLAVLSLFCAEEKSVDQAHANNMPNVNLFGPDYRRMMKDVIFAVGNYGQVYEKFVEPYLPRAGTPNQLNAEADPQLFSFPGPIV